MIQLHEKKKKQHACHNNDCEVDFFIPCDKNQNSSLVVRYSYTEELKNAKVEIRMFCIFEVVRFQ